MISFVLYGVVFLTLLPLCCSLLLSVFCLHTKFAGRDMVEYLHEALSFHVAQELSHNDGDDLPTKLERAFLIADIHSKTVGVQLSGATVAMCLIQVSTVYIMHISSLSAPSFPMYENNKKEMVADIIFHLF